MASTSVSELAVATMAAGVQKKYLRKYYGSIASDHAIAVTLSQVTPVSSKKPKTCRVLGLDIKCKACKERRKANRCARRQEWFASQQTEHVPTRPRRAAMAAAAAIAENLQDGEVEDLSLIHI